MELTQGQTAVLGVGIVIFTIINWRIYHKMFDITYFGNPFRGMGRELFGCIIVAVIEVTIIKMALGSVLSFLFSFIVKYVIPFVLVVIGLIVLFVIYCKVKEWWEGKNADTATNSTYNTLNSNTEPQAEVVNAANQIKNIIVNYVKNYPERREDEVIKEFLSKRGLKIEAVQNVSMDKEDNFVRNVFCSHCGKQILSTQKFCNYCGGKVNLPL